MYTATGGTSLKGIAFAPTDLPNFSVTASAPAAAAVGSQFNYTLTATNAGPANATGVPGPVHVAHRPHLRIRVGYGK